MPVKLAKTLKTTPADLRPAIGKLVLIAVMSHF
jgi:hypothetical protein